MPFLTTNLPPSSLCFNGYFPGEPGLAGVYWSNCGDNLTTGAISHTKLQSNHHHQQTNIHFFYRPDALPVAQPTVSNTEGKILHPMDLLTPNSPGGLPTLSLTTNSSWLPGEICMPLISPMPVPQCNANIHQLIFSSIQTTLNKHYLANPCGNSPRP